MFGDIFTKNTLGMGVNRTESGFVPRKRGGKYVLRQPFIFYAEPVCKPNNMGQPLYKRFTQYQPNFDRISVEVFLEQGDNFLGKNRLQVRQISYRHQVCVPDLMVVAHQCPNTQIDGVEHFLEVNG